MCLAGCCLVLVERDNSLPCATLFSNFSTAKKLHSKERKQKPFAAQTPPRKRGFILHTSNYRRQNVFAPPKFSIFARRCCALLDGVDIYTQAVDITPNSYAMSRCGLRKLCFRLKNAIFTRYYAANRTYFCAQLAYRQETRFKFYFYV